MLNTHHHPSSTWGGGGSDSSGMPALIFKTFVYIKSCLLIKEITWFDNYNIFEGIAYPSVKKIGYKAVVY